MEASTVDLRYKTKEILKALERNEEVRIHYRGKLKGRILPASRPAREMPEAASHPFFASSQNEQSVDELMEALRSPRT